MTTTAARQRIHDLLYGPQAPITRHLHEALDWVGEEWQVDKDEITQLRAENERLAEQVKDLRRYSHLLILGHHFQCNARDGMECDCGMLGVTNKLRVTEADSVAGTVTLSMTIPFWDGVVMGQTVGLRELG